MLNPRANRPLWGRWGVSSDTRSREEALVKRGSIWHRDDCEPAMRARPELLVGGARFESTECEMLMSGRIYE